MDIFPHQSCKTWLLSEICREFLNDDQQSYIEVNHSYKNGKQCLLISLLLQKTLSLQEFQCILHDPENTENILLMCACHVVTEHRL